MSTIKHKKGICIDCGAESKEVYLMAKRCQKHYWAHRNKVNKDKQKANGVQANKMAQSKARNLWFAGKIAAMPRHCEECGDYLNPYAPWGARAYCAHVLPKRDFKSVETHPLNCIYLCVSCHTNLDSCGFDKVSKMRVFPKILSIQLQLLKQLQPSEICSLPDYLLEYINN